MDARDKAGSEMTYLDMQAYVGVTKHCGGFPATDELLSLCHIAEAREVLDVGCGIGVGPVYIARTHGCRVVGVDISEKMLQWARLRAKRARVADRVEFRTADVRDLPFEEDRFDVVICESVLGFVEDKAGAIRGCVRVTRPGGYVGLNETVWLREPPADLRNKAREFGVDIDIVTAAAWQALWEGGGLQDRVARLYEIEPRTEIQSRLRWVGGMWALKAFLRLFRLYLTNRAMRPKLRQMFGSGVETLDYMGYGLFAGKKSGPISL